MAATENAHAAVRAARSARRVPACGAGELARCAPGGAAGDLYFCAESAGECASTHRGGWRSGVACVRGMFVLTADHEVGDDALQGGRATVGEPFRAHGRAGQSIGQHEIAEVMAGRATANVPQ